MPSARTMAYFICLSCEVNMERPEIDGAAAHYLDEMPHAGSGHRPYAVRASQCDHNMSPMRLQLNRDDRTAIELFIAGVQGWEAGLRRRLDGGKAKPE